MEIRQRFLTRNECYKVGRKITVRKLMVHSTACAGVPAQNFVSSWNQNRPNGRQVCVHAFMDPGVVYQTLPWNHRAWHCGGSGNDTAIGIEWCEPSNYGDKEYFNSILKTGIELYAYLCKQYGLSVNDIISHKEGCAMGIASNHGDPDHWWRHVGYSMSKFRAAVAEYLKSGKVDVKVEAPTYSATNVNYDAVVIPAIGANVRSGSGTGYAVVTAIECGRKVHISKESNGWGFNGTGWIYLPLLNKKSTTSVNVDNSASVSYKAVVVPSIGVNVRSGPGMDYGVMLSIACGREVVISKESNGWGFNGTGWIYLKNLSKKSSATISGGGSSKYRTGNYTLATTMKVRTGPGTNYRQKSKSELTADGKKHANVNGCLVGGTVVTVSEVRKNGNSYWARIPSGWVCLELNGERFVK